MANRIESKAGLKSILACLKASTEASFGVSDETSSLFGEVYSISALKGCPRAESTVSRPRPVAFAFDKSNKEEATAAPSTLRPREIIGACL